MTDGRYTHGHHESVLRSHLWRTAENSAAFLLPHLTGDATLLDVGCGPGNITADLASRLKNGVVVGIDQSPDVIAQATRNFPPAAHANLEFREGNVYRLEFDDAFFDVVYVHQVLQHLSDPVAALKEMRRVLKPGGRLVWIAAAPAGFKPSRSDVEVLRPRVARDRPHLERMKELLAAGAVWPPAITRYPLAEAAEAHRISEGRHLQGKLVLIVR